MKRIRKIRNSTMACLLCACMLMPTSIVKAQEEPIELEKTDEVSTPSTYAYDFDGPVVENIEFPQNHQIVKAGTTLVVYLDAYDLGSGINEIRGSVSTGDSEDSSSNYISFTFVKEEENRYKGEFVVPSGYRHGHISDITATDVNGNMTVPTMFDNMEYLYSFTIQNDSTISYEIESVDFQHNSQTINHNTSTSMKIKLTSTSNQDLETLNAHFTEENGKESFSLFLRKNENGMYVTEGAIINCASGVYTLTSIEGYRESSRFSLKLPEQEVQFTMDSENDGKGPIITSFQMDKKGQTLAANDVITFEVEVADVTNVSKEGVSLHLSPAVSLSYDYGYFTLTFDETSQTFKGKYTIPEGMYPCEWYVSDIKVYDKYNNDSDDNNILTFDRPYYFNVVKDGDFTNPTYNVSLSFHRLNELGEYELVNEVNKENIERRSTLKEAGITLPDGSTTYQGLKFKGWINQNQEFITEDHVVVHHIYDSFYASYDKIPLQLNYTYVDKDMQMKSVRHIVLAEKGMTYAQALALDDAVITDMYSGLTFEEWKINGMYNDDLDSVIKEGTHSFLNLNASYDKIAMRLHYNYVNSKMEIRQEYHTILADKGMTYAEVLASDKQKPTDLYSGLSLKGWINRDDENFDFDKVIEETQGNYFSMQASYDKNFVNVSYQYLNENMQNNTYSHVIMIDKDTTYKDILSVDKDVPKNLCEEANFEKWKLRDIDESSLEKPVKNYEYLSYNAVFEKTPITISYMYSGTSFYNHMETKSNLVKKGSTYKEALKDLQAFRPSNMTQETPFKHWEIKQAIDENQVVPEEGIRLDVKSVFEQIPLRIIYTYFDKDGKSDFKYTKILMNYDDTYGDILKKDTGIPNELYEGLTMNGWAVSHHGSALANDQKIDDSKYVIYITAQYESVPVIMNYQYLDKNKQTKTVSNIIHVKEGTKYSDVIAMDKNTPKDVWTEGGFQKWDVDHLDYNDNEQVITMQGNNDLIIYPTYENKRTLYTMFEYYDEQGHTFNEADMILVDEGKTFGDMNKELVNKSAPNTFKGLDFIKWESTGWAPEESPIENGSYMYFNATYRNSIVRILIDDIYKDMTLTSQGRLKWVTGSRDTASYVSAYVVSENEMFTIPLLANFENLTLFHYDGEKMTKLAAGEKILIDGHKEIYGFAGSENEPVDPTPPILPEEPEHPTPPITPEEPEQPDTETKPTVPTPPSIPSTDGETYIPEETKKEIIKEITEKVDGEKVTVDMKDAKIVSKDILEAAKGKDIVVELQFKGYTWSINGKEIIATNIKDINLEVTFDQNRIPNKIIKDLAKDNPMKQLSLAHNGDFGFKATLNVNVGTEYFGKYGNLYYYDSSNKLVYMNAGKIDENGNVSLDFTHASEYVIIIHEQNLSAMESQRTSSPATGDTTDITMMVLSMMISCGCLLFVTLRKKTKYKRIVNS